MPRLHAQACNRCIRVNERGYEAVPSLGARQRGIAHRFPSTRLRGMDSQHANAGRGVSTLFECDAARLIESGNWQLACDGRGEVLHGGTPLSQPLRHSWPATSVCALACRAHEVAQPPPAALAADAVPE